MRVINRKQFLFHAALLAKFSVLNSKARPASAGIVSLSFIARLYSMRLYTSGRKFMMENKYNKLEMESNNRRAWINGVMIWLHEPCRKSKSGWGIHEVDFKGAIDPILRAHAHAPAYPPRLVVLDPGHGGKDTGASGKNKLYEKQIVLDIAARAHGHLAARKIPVRMTRTGDTYPTLQQRTDYVGKVGADLFVSIHANGAKDPDARGVESFITSAAGYDSSNHYGQGGNKSAQRNNGHDAANAMLGFSIQSNLVKKSQCRDRGLRRARFAVIKNAPCPAALVECGFLTNPAEASLLSNAEGREKMARGISNGIVGYIAIIKEACRRKG